MQFTFCRSHYFQRVLTKKFGTTNISHEYWTRFSSQAKVEKNILKRLIIMMTVSVVFLAVRMKKSRVERQHECMTTKYCDIDESAMQGIRDVEMTESRTGNNSTEARMETDHIRKSKMTIEEETLPTSVDERYYENYGRDETLYANEEDLKLGSLRIEHEDDNAVGPCHSREKKPNKNYVPLDVSTMDRPGPPSVYKILKSNKASHGSNKPTNGSSFGSCDLDCSEFKQKLPTPESNSLSGSSC